MRICNTGNAFTVEQSLPCQSHEGGQGDVYVDDVGVDVDVDMDMDVYVE